MERLYNHVADFGMICNDTGFAVAHSHCFRIRERLLRLNKRLTGNRLLRGGIVPGGVGHPVPHDLNLPAELDSILADFNEVVEISLNNTMLMDRLEGTGQLTTKTATDHGVLGYVARASGINVDVRRDHPFAAYHHLKFNVPVFETRRCVCANDGARGGGARVGGADQAGDDTDGRWAVGRPARPAARV